MAQYIVCNNCKKLVEYIPETRYEGGISYLVFKCPECGYVKSSSTNHIHYGNDGLR